LRKWIKSHLRLLELLDVTNPKHLSESHHRDPRGSGSTVRYLSTVSACNSRLWSCDEQAYYEVDDAPVVEAPAVHPAAE